jgi:hypothetical protein
MGCIESKNIKNSSNNEKCIKIQIENYGSPKTSVEDPKSPNNTPNTTPNEYVTQNLRIRIPSDNINKKTNYRKQMYGDSEEASYNLLCKC